MLWGLQDILGYTRQYICLYLKLQDGGLLIASIVCQEWGLLLQRSSCPTENGLISGQCRRLGSYGWAVQGGVCVGCTKAVNGARK